MEIELTRPTTGRLADHMSSLPPRRVCCDSNEDMGFMPPTEGLGFVAGINCLAWQQCNEIYRWPSNADGITEWENVGHTVPEILSKWSNYGLFGTNIDGWFTLDPVREDIARAIQTFGFVIYTRKDDEGSYARVLCGYHYNLGYSVFGCHHGYTNLSDENAEVYVVIPTIYAELDHPSMQYLKYETLETQ